MDGSDWLNAQNSNDILGTHPKGGHSASNNNNDNNNNKTETSAYTPRQSGVRSGSPQLLLCIDGTSVLAPGADFV